jgi:3-deoxy-D-manno-octulosonic-acid transferase
VVAWLRHAGSTLLALAAAPVVGTGLVVRPSWRVGIGERLGLVTPRSPGAIWIHGASVGEILSATGLLDALLERGRPVVASTTTASGRSVLARARPGIPLTLAPLDHPWCVELALRRVAPTALVLIETELWPGWIAASARHGIPVAVVSARISDRSFARYRALAPLVRGTFARLAAVGARTEVDAERFRALGLPAERVRVTGDLKLEPPASPSALAPDLAPVLAGRFWVAASTHAGEERAALDALEAADASGLATPLVLAPRRLERGEEIARLVLRRGRRLRRRTRPGPPVPLAPGEVLLLDSLGELPAVIGRAQFAFVGGSLVPVGGHNVLEPARAGRAALFGPYTDNVREAAERLLACGGARRVQDASELAAAAVEWLLEPDLAEAAGEAARAELEKNRGATVRSLLLIEALLAARDGAAA